LRWRFVQLTRFWSSHKFQTLRFTLLDDPSVFVHPCFLLKCEMLRGLLTKWGAEQTGRPLEPQGHHFRHSTAFWTRQGLAWWRPGAAPRCFNPVLQIWLPLRHLQHKFHLSFSYNGFPYTWHIPKIILQRQYFESDGHLSTCVTSITAT
jgi:hypothetical protein